MKIVIDMPEDTYKDIVKNGFIYDEDNEVVTHAIKNGTPLDDIKAEIERAKTVECKFNDTAFKANADYVVNPQFQNFTGGLDMALRIIDKHIGKEQNK